MSVLSRLVRWAGFRWLGPWITRFEIGGAKYGGWYDGANDPRLRWFFARFPNPGTVLELGSLEGGHTYGLIRGGARKVVAVEGRTDNLARARFAQRQLGYRGAEFVQADLETCDLTTLGRFDTVFCCGLLYHLPRPWELLAKIAAVTDRLFLSTHFTTADPPRTTQHGYPGQWVGEHGLRDPLSGLSQRSFWPTLDGLTRMLADVGFRIDPIFAEDRDHPNGPLVTLAAVR